MPAADTKPPTCAPENSPSSPPKTASSPKNENRTPRHRWWRPLPTTTPPRESSTTSQKKKLPPDVAAPPAAATEEPSFPSSPPLPDEALPPPSWDGEEPDDELDTIKRKLQVAEMLEAMSHLSALERERTDLELIKAKVRDDGGQGTKLNALRRKIARMATSLEADIKRVDARLGDKLHIIDQDNDGVIDADELRHAVKAILKGKDQSLRDDRLDSFVDSIMADIDRNHDGILTVQEVEAWCVLFCWLL
mmetsp:Transcript_29141/g.89100  ORF Transcript_29141/g.89100 Transcript_29141/m.89100 type:complete len:249 (-) Transcript_29141:316-1062(-)